MVSRPPAASGQAEVKMADGSLALGEVKKLEYTKLTLDTESFGLIQIDWDQIVSMSATGPFKVRFADGRTPVGSIEVDSVNFRLINSVDTLQLPKSEVASFQDFDIGFWNQAAANVDLGANIVRGNSRVSQFSLSMDLGWRSDRASALLRGSSILYDQTDAPDTRRFTATAAGSHEMIHRLSAGLVVSYERDENQQLDIRLLSTLFVSLRAISRLRSSLDLIVGAGPTHEQYTGEEGRTIGELRSGFSYRGKPSGATDIHLSSFVYPSTFNFERIRIESDLTFRIELLEDLTLNANSYFRYNNQPPPGVEESDFGLTLGVGWSY